jgi:hypothetical protein
MGALLDGEGLNDTNHGAQGIAESERALALNPNLANAHAIIGFAKLVNGHAEETENHVLEALRVIYNMLRQGKVSRSDAAMATP